MRLPRALRMEWFDFDLATDEEREELRDEVERFFAEMDLQCFKAVTGEAHPNADYEYQPLIAVFKKRGNY